MDQRKIPWKAEWKAVGLDPGPLTEDEAAWVPVLEVENQEFLKKHPRQKKAAPLKKGTFRSPWIFSVPAAAALLVLMTMPATQVSRPGTPLERIKGSGETVLTVYRQGAGKAEKLDSRSPVRAGDVLQAAYQVSRPLQGALVSLDGGGNVTVHLARQGRSVALVPGGEHPLEFSYELDRAPRYEVFFLITSERPFDLEPIRQILKQSSWESLGPSAFGKDIHFTALALTKAAPE